MSDFPFGYLDGLWVGSLGSNPLIWTISVAPEDTTPSIFGARLVIEDGSVGGSYPVIFSGTWSSSSLQFELQETSSFKSDSGSEENSEKVNLTEVLHYKGKFVQSVSQSGEKVWGLLGEWSSPSSKGTFFLARENANPFSPLSSSSSSDIVITGTALGRSVPDDSLRDFLIPTNQIHWSIAIIPPSVFSKEGGESETESMVFGAGFFDDSADVPGQRVLMFSIGGTYNPATSTAVIKKSYQTFSQTKGYHVDYEIEFIPPSRDAPSGTFVGKWKNQSSGAWGACSARFQSPISKKTGSILVICEQCGKPMAPGAIRWFRRDSESSQLIDDSEQKGVGTEILCPSCLAGSETPSAYYPAIYSDSTIISGQSCAELLRKSFSIFDSRAFFSLVSNSPNGVLPIDHPFYSPPPPNAPPAPQLHRHPITYKQIGEWTEQIASALFKHLGTSLHRSHIFVATPPGPTSAILQLAGLVCSGILVPVPTNLDSRPASEIITNLRPSVCFIHPAATGAAKAIFDTISSQKYSPLVIQLDVLVEKSLELPCEGEEIKIEGMVKLSKILEEGKAIRKERAGDPTPFPPTINLSKNELSAVLFTSGSTSMHGSSKGASFTEDLIYPSEGACSLLPAVHLDFQPYDPTYIISVLQSCQCGGERGVARGLDTVLTEDCQILRPTHVAASPVFWTGLYREYLSKVAKAGLGSLDEIDRVDRLDTIARSARSLLGNRILVSSSGGAAIGETVQRFLSRTLKLDFSELYGSRETGGITRNQVVYPGVEVALLGVPELGYEGTPGAAVEGGSPGQVFSGETYRGEVCVHSPRLIQDYYSGKQNGSKSSSFFQMEGKRFYRTGDIGELWLENEKTKLKLIDRIGAMTKLSDGVWISPSKIEGILEQSPFVSSAFVMGSPEHPFCVAAVVPSPQLHSLGKEQSEEKLRFLEKELRTWCVQNALSASETPIRYHLEKEPWNSENGLMTSTEKKKRLALSRHYEFIKIDLLSHGASFSSSSSSSSSSPSSPPLSSPLSPLLMNLLASLFPPSTIDTLTKSSFFSQIGGDSIAAARFSSSLRKHNINVPLSDVFKFPLSYFSDLLASKESGSSEGFDTAAVYGVVNQFETRKIDWDHEFTLPSDFKEDILSNASSHPANGLSRSTPKPGNVCLVGPTGFLGPYLIASVLRTYPSSVKVFCLGRGSAPAHLQSRVEKGLKESQLWEQVEEHVSRLHFVCYSLSTPKLGLEPAVYDQLIVDLKDGHIFHNAAWVNMVLPYEGLKATNVGGMLNALRMALQARARFHFISSVAALPSTCVDEKWMRFGTNEMEKKDGYGQTKSVCERLLQNAMALDPQLDIRLYRPCYVCGDSKSGRTNGDFTSHLFRSCVLAKCAPISEADTKLFHWIPVDFVARGIISIAQSDDPSLSSPPSISLSPQEGGVFHFSRDGPLLGTILRRLRLLYPEIADVSSEQWRENLTKLEVEGDKPYSDLELTTLTAFQWSDPTGLYARGVNTYTTQKILKAVCDIDYCSRVSENDLDLSLKFLRDSNFFQKSTNK